MTDDALQAYVDGLAAEHRPLFDRVHRLVLATAPDATVSISYGMPTYRVGRRRLYVGAWAHGVSLYGWRSGGDDGFVERHPELVEGKGTIRLTPSASKGLDDTELAGLVRATLAG
jgi:uncharacterized protein YdhG (YjbR/CyaY superfamily)